MGSYCSVPSSLYLDGGDPFKDRDAGTELDLGEPEPEVEEKIPQTEHPLQRVVTPDEPDGQPPPEPTQEDMEESRRKHSVLQEEMTQLKQLRYDEYKRALSESRRQMRTGHYDFGSHAPANRYGSNVELPPFEPGKHVPLLALLNPLSGAMAGSDILSISRHTPYYQDRFFNIIDVVKGQLRGGLMDVFREELKKAKDEAKAMGTRPRLISGGGDGTGSFALFIVFTALKADNERAEDGLQDAGNGFIWTDTELEESFPALAQMPLGSANDFGNVLGWGQKYPGDRPCSSCVSREKAAASLIEWIDAVLSPASSIVNFDIWGLMPAHGQSECDFKIAELTGRRGFCPNPLVGDQRQLLLKVAGKPVPFFVCLYFSVGFGPYMTARFQINRRKTPIKNRLEYIRQAVGIMREAVPPQMNLRLNGVEIDCGDEHYFPPNKRARTIQGRRYREVGFLNINWQAHLLHGADRAGVMDRLRSSPGSREPVRFNDGLLDMYRWKFKSLLKNPGPVLQTDKKKDLLLTFSGEKGKGVFFQWDGEARFAFSKTGEPFHMYVRKVLTVPVVLGPFLVARRSGFPINGEPPKFEFSGDTAEDKELAKQRLLSLVFGRLDKELLATRDDIEAAGLCHADSFITAEDGGKAVQADEQ